MINETNKHFKTFGPRRKRKQFDSISFFFNRAVLIALLGALLFLLLLPLVMYKGRNYYTTSGLVLIGTERPGVSKDPEFIRGRFNYLANTQASLIKTNEVMERALEKLGDQKPAFIPENASLLDQAKILNANVDVTYVKNSYVLDVSLTSSDPEGLGATVNAVMDAYLEMSQKNQQQQSNSRLSYLKEERAETEKTLIESQNKLDQIAEKLNSNIFDQQLHSSFNLLAVMQQDYSNALVKLFDAESQYQKALSNQNDISLLGKEPHANEKVIDNQGYFFIQSWTYQELQRMRRLTQGLATANPEYKYLQDRMEGMENYLANYKDELFDNWSQIFKDKSEYELNLAVIEAENEYEAAKSHAEKVKEQLNAATEASQRNSRLIREAKDIQVTLDRYRNRLFELDTALDTIEVEAKAPLHISVAKKATDPDGPSGSSIVKFAILNFIFSFGLVGTFVLGLDLLDDKIRQPKDLQLALGAVPGSPIPYYDGKGDYPNFARCTLDDPMHPAATAIRSLAVKINSEREMQGSKSYMFTGIGDHSGSTEVLLNVAHTLASFVPRVLVIDATISNSTLAKHLASGESKPTLSDVIHSPDRLDQSFVYDSERSISVLLGGTGNPLDLYKPEFMDVLKRCTEQFDVVLIDSPEPLKNDRSQYLLLHSQAAVLVACQDKSEYNELYESIEMVIQNEVGAMTAVLNQYSTSSKYRLDVILRNTLRGLIMFLDSIFRGILKILGLFVGQSFSQTEKKIDKLFKTH